MIKKRKIFSVVSLLGISMLIFSQVVLAVHIEIKPIVEGQEYCIMKLGETQTFQALGFGWDENAKQNIPEKEIKGIQWSFDGRFLELVETKDSTITLQAIKARTSRLTVTGTIDGEIVTKTIFIVVQKDETNK